MAESAPALQQAHLQMESLHLEELCSLCVLLPSPKLQSATLKFSGEVPMRRNSVLYGVLLSLMLNGVIDGPDSALAQQADLLEPITPVSGLPNTNPAVPASSVQGIP